MSTRPAAWRRNASLIIVLIGLIAPIAGAEATVIGDFGWGAAAGIAGALGLTALYRGLATTLMTVVAPATALVAVAVLASGTHHWVVSVETRPSHRCSSRSPADRLPNQSHFFLRLR